MDMIQEHVQIDQNLMNINYNKLHIEHWQHVLLGLINKFLKKQNSFFFSFLENEN